VDVPTSWKRLHSGFPNYSTLFRAASLSLVLERRRPAATPCAEVLMTEDQVRALMEAGMMPLVSYRDSDRVRMAGFRAINGDALVGD